MSLSNVRFISDAQRLTRRALVRSRCDSTTVISLAAKVDSSELSKTKSERNVAGWSSEVFGVALGFLPFAFVTLVGWGLDVLRPRGFGMFMLAESPCRSNGYSLLSNLG